MAEPVSQRNQIEPTLATDFPARMTRMINDAALALMVSIGHRTGLFDVMARIPPATSPEIARRSGLDERYVREWLGAMVTGGIATFEPATARYHLPAEHAAALTRAARPGNMATTCQWIPLLAGVEDEIVRCFEQGGGVPYSAFGRFHAVMAEESDQTVVAVLLEEILPRVPGALESLELGIDVLDVGCGSGRALCRMAARFPRSRFTGYDLCLDAVEAATEESRELGLANVRFEVRDVAHVDQREVFDLVTAFDAIHDQADPRAVLVGIARALRADGTFLMQEIGGTGHLRRDREHPLAPFIYTISCLHCMTVSLAAGGAGLGAMWGEETARRMLREAGFSRVEVTDLPHDPINKYYVARVRRGLR